MATRNGVCRLCPRLLQGAPAVGATNVSGLARKRTAILIRISAASESDRQTSVDKMNSAEVDDVGREPFLVIAARGVAREEGVSSLPSCRCIGRPPMIDLLHGRLDRQEGPAPIKGCNDRGPDGDRPIYLGATRQSDAREG